MSETYCYFREDGLTAEAVRSYARVNGIALRGVLSDRSGEYGSFRNLQNLIKLGACRRVLMPSPETLGEDEYTALENLLFLVRNGVRPLFMHGMRRVPYSLDARLRVAGSAKALTQYAEQWRRSYGTAFPARDTRQVFSRKPPFGYMVEQGKAVICERDAQVVRAIFRAYAEGSSIYDIFKAANEMPSSRQGTFTHMTVKSMLSNARYTGRRSKKGYSLPGLVDTRTWFDARARFERDYPKPPDAEPFFAPLIRGERPVFFRMGARPASNALRAADADALEYELYRMVGRLAAQENAEHLLGSFVTPALNAAQAALPRAQSEAEEANRAFNLALGSYLENKPNAERSKELMKFSDKRVMLNMRVRRVQSQIDLLSLSPDDVRGFFSRARRIEELSEEERLFIVSTFVLRVSFYNDVMRVVYVSPKRNCLCKHDIELKH